MQSFLNANRAAAKSDLDDGLFGKRTAGKKVGKLFRVTDEIKRGTLAEDQHLTTMGNRLNGVLSNGLGKSPPKVLTMVTRRSNNSRRTIDAASDSRKRTPAKVVKKLVSDDVPLVDQQEDEEEENDPDEMEEEHLMDVDELEDDEEEAESDSNSDGDLVETNTTTGVLLTSISDGKMRARRESAKRINYAEPREDEENSLGATFAMESVTKSKKIEKLRLRSIRWRPPSQEERSGMSQPFYKVVDDPPRVGGGKHRLGQSSSRLAVGEASRRSKESLSETNGMFLVVSSYLLVLLFISSFALFVFVPLFGPSFFGFLFS